MSAADLAQRAAADPASSAWVDASAGSGKTKVLVDRILRLLLGVRGAPAMPQRILCLTFTNAAAAEMANRLNARLSEWAVARDDDLRAALSGLLGAPPDAQTCATARRLLTRVLDTPGGMRIQTVHAFCQSLLRRFPFEAGVSPHFDVIDERQAGELMADVQSAAVAGLDTADGAMLHALDVVTRNVHETRIADLLGELAGERNRFRRLLRRYGGLDALIEAMHEAVGIARGTTPDDVVRAASADGAFAKPDLRALAAGLAAGSAGDAKRGAAVAAWIDAGPDARAAGFDGYGRVFLTSAGEPRKTVATKAVVAGAPQLADVIDRERERLLAANDDRRRAAVAGATAALLTLGGAVVDSYQARKRGRGWLDFDDLILEARDLLNRSGLAAWVLYKLDGGLDHILIDEAQDTSPEQWEVVQALAEEFFAGEGARDAVRTVFAVGDPKQSIYGFQRADPAKFAEMRAWFSRRVRDAGQGWNDVPLTASFRSARPVLAAVDAVFAAPEARSGMTFDERPVVHTAERAGQAGRVELWPLAAAPAAAVPDPWKPPVERIAAPAAADLLAQQVAAEIHRLCDGTHRLESRGRAIRPDDVLVLVRRRNRFVEDLVRRLKERDVPVAGVDRLRLADHIAVMDLMALGRFLLLPSDDLSLAEALKSPLFGFDDEALFDLAWERGRQSLWRRLTAEAESRPLFAAAAERLRRLLARADFVSPYELYAGLLGADGGRRRFLARLGAEAGEPLDAFLAQALAWERAAAPSLQGFLHWLERGDVEIKREQEPGGGGAVRVMTVHGAKGMEAPVVFLPDTAQTPRVGTQLVWAPDGSMVLWPVRRDLWDPLSRRWREAAAARDRDEYRRLLYVAMTRAEDRLVVCGWRGRGEPPDDSWYAMAERGLESVPCEVEPAPGAQSEGESVRVLRSAQTAAADRADGVVAAVVEEASPPPWLDAAAPRERALEPRPPARSGAARAPAAAARGERLHRCLQTWPELPADMADDDRALVAAVVAAVRADPVFAPVFGAGARAEVPVAAPRPRPLSGRIDRLVVTAGAVLAVDFKSGAKPADGAPPPGEYVRQMAAYRGALRAVFPERPVRCALVWIDGAALTPLDDRTLDEYAS